MPSLFFFRASFLPAYTVKGGAFLSSLSSSRYALPFRFLETPPASRCRHAYPAPRKRKARAIFFHARTCRNKGRPGKGRVGHERTDSRGVAPRKWIQLNSHTLVVGLSRAEIRSRSCRYAYARGRKDDGREGRGARSINPRQTNKQMCLSTRTSCKRDPTNRKFRRCRVRGNDSQSRKRTRLYVELETGVGDGKKKEEPTCPAGNDLSRRALAELARNEART